MAIARDVSSKGSASATTITVAHTCTGSNVLLLSGVYTEGANDITVTYNTVSMTQLNFFDHTVNGTKIYVFGILLGTGDATSHNIVVTGGSANFKAVISESYSGVSQSGLPDSAPTGSQVTAASITQNFTTIANNAWVFAFVDGGPTIAAGTGATEIDTLAVNGISAFDNQTNGAITPAGSYALSATHAAGTLGIVGISFAPLVAAASSARLDRLQLLGVS